MYKQIMCDGCAKLVPTIVEVSVFKDYERGYLSLDSLKLSDELKELVISGICDVCWEKDDNIEVCENESDFNFNDDGVI